MIHKKTFTNSDLNGSFQFEYTHNLGTSDIIASWKDENGISHTTDDLFQVIDDNNIILNCNGAVTGTQTLYLSYNEAGVAASGRRAFELSTTTNPNTTLRLIMGKASTPAVNMTLSSLLTWLLNQLGFLKIANNLSDVNNAATARGNLNVYSQAQVDALLALKAALYQSGSGAVLGVANTSIFNPTSNYHPATFRNVKNLGWKMLLVGSVSSTGTWGATKFLNTDVLDLDDIASSRTGTGTYRITHEKGDVNYSVIAVALGSTNVAIGMAKLNRQATYFDLHFGDDDSLNDTDFEFFMFDFNAYTADE